jgi:hypothetical protein
MAKITPVKNMIFTLRSQRVMLDSDLAKLYEVETKVLNQAVKRNISRFPADFMFRLTKEEWTILRSQTVTFNNDTRKYCPMRLPNMAYLCFQAFYIVTLQ